MVVGGQDHAPGHPEDTGVPQPTPQCGGPTRDHPHGRGPGLGTATNSGWLWCRPGKKLDEDWLGIWLTCSVAILPARAQQAGDTVPCLASGALR